MGPEAAREFYAGFLALVRSMYSEDRVKDGRFGAMMQVALVNGADLG
jgi:D-Tyr-tRNAtyr deacylase